MTPTFDALAVAVIVPLVLQVIKQRWPGFICGRVLKRALIFCFAFVVTLGMAAWEGKPFDPAQIGAATVLTTLAAEGAYRYLLNTWKEAEDGEPEP